MQDLNEDIRKLIKESRSLPTLPGIITKLTELEGISTTSTADMTQIISADQILSAKVLRLVNSPFYGFSRRVSTISNALILLGVNVIKSLLLSSSIFEIMEKTVIGLWEHSLASAAAANTIAKHLQLQDIEEISTAALLHDIGKVVITVLLQNDYQKLLNHARDKDCSTYLSERELLQTDHAEVGQWLALSWYLPEKLQEPIAFHHNVEASIKFRTTTAVVHYADILVKARGVGFSGDNLVPPIQAAAREALQIDTKMMAAIIEELEDRLVEVRNFSMDIQTTEEDDDA
jgi:putative nucleotidyltransferase with HDIG domain